MTQHGNYDDDHNDSCALCCQLLTYSAFAADINVFFLVHSLLLAFSVVFISVRLCVGEYARVQPVTLTVLVSVVTVLVSVVTVPACRYRMYKRSYEIARRPIVRLLPQRSSRAVRWRRRLRQLSGVRCAAAPTLRWRAGYLQAHPRVHRQARRLVRKKVTHPSAPPGPTTGETL